MGMSLEAPTAGNRTVWPLVMAGLYLAGMVSAFCVAIPVSLSKVSLASPRLKALCFPMPGRSAQGPVEIAP